MSSDARMIHTSVAVLQYIKSNVHIIEEKSAENDQWLSSSDAEFIMFPTSAIRYSILI